MLSLRFLFSLLAGTLLFVSTGCQPARPMNASSPNQLQPEQAAHFAELAARCIQVEYPNKLSHIMNDSSEVVAPREIHPAFYGCFDWHSSVHGHWMLVRLLKRFPNLPNARTYRQMISANLTVENIAREVVYLNQPNRKSFERTYGWAWLLKLVEELEGWEDAEAQVWRENLRPLEELFVARYLSFLPRQTYAIRTGLHPNTAFGLSFAWDYAQHLDHQPLAELIQETGMRYYGSDTNCPVGWEPGGSDFLSPCLEEANFMRRILPQEEFVPWLRGFFPTLFQANASQVFEPAVVADRSDPQIVHLDGLNLSRAWCMQGLASALPAESKEAQLLRKAANEHLEATLPYIASGNYEGEHWLASFAVYAMTE